MDASTTLFENFPAHKVEDARRALDLAHARLVRSATRVGQAPPERPGLFIVAERVRSRCRACRTTVDGFPPADHRCFSTSVDAYAGGSWTSIALVDLELTAGRPALAGWVFLAAIEPLKGGNLIRRVPGADVAEGELAPWATGAIACDHCRAKRRRAETFIVRANGDDPAIPAGTYRQVGRQCVAAFLGGRSAATIVAQLAWPDVVRGVGDEDGEGGWGGGRAAKRFDPAVFMAQVAAVIRLDGWRSRGQARADEGGPSATADRVIGLLTPPFSDPRGDWKREAERCAPLAEDLERGTAALAWAKALTGESDYERNLSLVARQPGVKHEHAGILASAVSSYLRALGREVERRRLADANASNPSGHVGEIKQRMNLELTVQRVVPLESDYGALNIISMRDDRNNLFVWKTGAENPRPGERLKLRGSVKKHDEYRGERQTILTRCQIVDEFPPEKPARKPRAKKAKAPAVEATRWTVGDEVSYQVLAGVERGDVHTGTIDQIDDRIAYVRERARGYLEAVSTSILRTAGSLYDVGSSTTPTAGAAGAAGA